MVALFGGGPGLTPADAQPYSLTWSKIAGGGGTSTGGVFQASGTIGQHDASGALSGGSFSVTGGFWSLISIVQTPGAPTLTVARSGNDVIVSWPLPSTGFFLQQNGSPNTTNWINSGFVVSSNANTLSITVPSPTGNLFFRLKQ